jgi:hypothetical protein
MKTHDSTAQEAIEKSVNEPTTVEKIVFIKVSTASTFIVAACIGGAIGFWPTLSLLVIGYLLYKMAGMAKRFRETQPEMQVAA